MQYEIKGAPFPAVICQLSGGESICCQKGAMSWMSPNVQMETSVGSKNGGGFLGALGKAATRALTGESIFQNTYTAQGGAGEIAFASSIPGEILAMDLSDGSSIVAQKSAYFVSTPGVGMEIFFQKKIGAGFFGGEGFIMQKFSGNGMVFLQIDGSVIQYELAAGQSMLIDTGYLAAMSGTCQIDVETISGIGNVLFGGEGLFNTRVTGPGKVWIQTMPTYQLAETLRPYFPTSSN